MSFIAPIMLALLALALPVFVAFLSRKKIEQKTVPSLVILKHVKAAEPRRRSFATPRNLLALILYLLAILALAVASAQPSFEGEEPREVIIVLDASYSMGVEATEDGQTALDLARQQIEDEVLAGLGPRDRATLIVGDVARRVHVEPTRDLTRHVTALEPIEVAGLHKHVMQSLELADALCRGLEHGVIVFVTDGMVPDGKGALPDQMSCPVTTMQVLDPKASVPANVALTRLAVRQIDALGNTEVYVEAYNPTAVDREVVIELELDDVPAEVLAIEVPAGRSAGQLTQVDGSLGTRLVARIAHQKGQIDAIAVDDVRHAVLNPVAWVDVLLVSDRKFSFMERAFSLHPRARMEIVSVAEAATKLEDRDLVIFEDGASQALIGAVPKQAKVVVLGAQASSGINFDEALDRPVMTWWDFDDELFRYVDLDEVEILEAAPIAAAPGDEVLMRAGQDQALLVRRQLQGHESLVMAFHPDQSDLVLRVAFANIVANIIEWCAADLEPPPAHFVEPGETLLDAPGATTLELIGKPDVSMPANAPMSRTGVWRILDGESKGQLVVVNQDGYSESQLQKSQQLYASSQAWDADAFSSGDRGAKLIRVLLLIALGVMIVEALVMWWRSRRAAQRRVVSGSLADRVRTGQEESR